LALAFFIWLESTALSVWVRESTSLLAFPFILYLHTLGLALIAGLSSAVALAIIFFAQPPWRTSLARLFPYMWVGLAINVVSGILLLMAYPAKALTNPVFFIKLIAIVIAVAILQSWQKRFNQQDVSGVSPQNSDALLTAQDPALIRAAWSLLGLWLIATVAGRFLAYTHSILLASITRFM
jgi:hypothetical protein